MNPLLEKKYLEEQMKDDTVSTFYLIFIPGQTSWEKAKVPHSYVLFNIFLFILTSTMTTIIFLQTSLECATNFVSHHACFLSFYVKFTWKKKNVGVTILKT